MKTTVIHLLFLVLVTETAKPLGEKCVLKSDCVPGLVCGLEDKLFNPQRICRCMQGYDWTEALQRCEDASNKEEVASVVTVLVPVLAAVIVTCIIVVCCCCWIHSSTISLQQEMKKSIKSGTYDEIELEMQPVEKAPKAVPIIQEEIAVEESDIKQEKDVIEELRNEIKASLREEEELKKKKLSAISDPGYQASMRLVLEPRPKTSFLSVNNGGLYSRPPSATFIDIDNSSRPTLARSPSTLSISGRRSPAINRPYLTENAFKRPPSAQIQNGGELAKLYDQFLLVKEDEKKPDVNVETNMEKPRKKSCADQEGIEEIRLVRVAVNAFKKRVRLKEKARSSKTTFETVVDKVIRMREFERKHVYSAKPARARTSSSSNSTLTSSVPSSRSSSVTSTSLKRPESVAQRVLRERQEKRISTKAPVSTVVAKRPKSSAGPKKKQPLHLALRKSASRHGSRAAMANKIKQQAHFSAVKNFQVPPLPPDLVKRIEMSQISQANGIPTYPESAPRPAKSILKKSSSNSEDRPIKKNSHVNYAFEFDDESSALSKKKKERQATVIDKKTGASKTLTLGNKEMSEQRTTKVVSVLVH